MQFLIRVAEYHLFGKELFNRFTVCLSWLWSNFECVLLSLLVLRVGCGM